MVICGDIEFADDRKDLVGNPSVIIEVLSPGTAHYDRGGKFVHYRSIPALADYLVVWQDRVQMEHWARQSDGSWLPRDYKALTDVVHISSIQADLPLAAIYEE